jgi:hypothetical protein
MIQELRLKVQVPTGTDYIAQSAKQILQVLVLGKPPMLLVLVMTHVTKIWTLSLFFSSPSLHSIPPPPPPYDSL